MIYLDNGATTLNKPPCVIQAVCRALQVCGNPGRGGHPAAMAAARVVYETREQAAGLFGCKPEQVVFTNSCTHGLNIAIRTLVKPGDKVVISGFEHNAVTRPLYALNAKISGKVFKATGGSVKLSKNNKSITFLFEVIRREPDWQKKLADKMAMYKEFYENFVQGDSGFSNLPQLILVCEDDKHTAESFKEIVKNKLEIPQIKLYFTTDLRQNSESLENTLIEFRIDEETKKYKMYNVEVKILGI